MLLSFLQDFIPAINQAVFGQDDQNLEENSDLKRRCVFVFVCASDDPERFLYPLLPCTPLTPISLLALKQSQIGSAVSLLEFHCLKNCWSPPEYQLYSTPGQDGKLLLIYKVWKPDVSNLAVHPLISGQFDVYSVLHTVVLKSASCVESVRSHRTELKHTKGSEIRNETFISGGPTSTLLCLCRWCCRPHEPPTSPISCVCCWTTPRSWLLRPRCGTWVTSHPYLHQHLSACSHASCMLACSK